ncbi:hypothetical protein SUDANB1_03921 [Streptomyces sp. enrichment culture]
MHAAAGTLPVFDTAFAVKQIGRLPNGVGKLLRAGDKACIGLAAQIREPTPLLCAMLSIETPELRAEGEQSSAYATDSTDRCTKYRRDASVHLGTPLSWV